MADSRIHQDVVEVIVEFFEDAYEAEIDEFTERWVDGHRSLVIDCGCVARFGQYLADDIVQHPNRMRDPSLMHCR